MNADWSLLPPGALRTIFSYFTQEELKSLTCVCKNWYEELQISLNSGSGSCGMADFDADQFLDMDYFEDTEKSQEPPKTEEKDEEPDKIEKKMVEEEKLVLEISIEVEQEKKQESEEEKRIRLLNSVQNVVKSLENRDPSSLTSEQKQKLQNAKASLEKLRSKGVFGRNKTACENASQDMSSEPEWKTLPPKALETIFSYLSIQEIMKISEVYKPWYDQFNRFLELGSASKGNMSHKKVGESLKKKMVSTAKGEEQSSDQPQPRMTRAKAAGKSIADSNTSLKATPKKTPAKKQAVKKDENATEPSKVDPKTTVGQSPTPVKTGSPGETQASTTPANVNANKPVSQNPDQSKKGNSTTNASTKVDPKKTSEQPPAVTANEDTKKQDLQKVNVQPSTPARTVTAGKPTTSANLDAKKQTDVKTASNPATPKTDPKKPVSQATTPLKPASQTAQSKAGNPATEAKEVSTTKVEPKKPVDAKKTVPQSPAQAKTGISIQVASPNVAAKKANDQTPTPAKTGNSTQVATPNVGAKKSNVQTPAIAKTGNSTQVTTPSVVAKKSNVQAPATAKTGNSTQVATPSVGAKKSNVQAPATAKTGNSTQVATPNIPAKKANDQTPAPAKTGIAKNPPKAAPNKPTQAPTPLKQTAQTNTGNSTTATQEKQVVDTKKVVPQAQAKAVDSAPTIVNSKKPVPQKPSQAKSGNSVPVASPKIDPKKVNEQTPKAGGSEKTTSIEDKNRATQNAQAKPLNPAAATKGPASVTNKAGATKQVPQTSVQAKTSNSTPAKASDSNNSPADKSKAPPTVDSKTIAQVKTAATPKTDPKKPDSQASISSKAISSTSADPKTSDSSTPAKTLTTNAVKNTTTIPAKSVQKTQETQPATKATKSAPQKPKETGVETPKPTDIEPKKQASQDQQAKTGTPAQNATATIAGKNTTQAKPVQKSRESQPATKVTQSAPQKPKEAGVETTKPTDKEPKKQASQEPAKAPTQNAAATNAGKNTTPAKPVQKIQESQPATKITQSAPQKPKNVGVETQKQDSQEPPKTGTPTQNAKSINDGKNTTQAKPVQKSQEAQQATKVTQSAPQKPKEAGVGTTKPTDKEPKKQASQEPPKAGTPTQNAAATNAGKNTTPAKPVQKSQESQPATKVTQSAPQKPKEAIEKDPKKQTSQESPVKVGTPAQKASETKKDGSVIVEEKNTGVPKTSPPSANKTPEEKTTFAAPTPKSTRTEAPRIRSRRSTISFSRSGKQPLQKQDVQSKEVAPKAPQPARITSRRSTISEADILKKSVAQQKKPAPTGSGTKPQEAKGTEEKDVHTYSAWSKIPPQALKAIVTFVTPDDAKKLNLVCKDWKESLKNESEEDDCDIEVLEEPTVMIDLVAAEEEEAKKLQDSLLVTVIERCSSDPVIKDKDWERLEEQLTKWIFEHKDRQAPRFEKLDQYKEHRILKCEDLETKNTLSEIISRCNKVNKATFEVVSKAEIPRRGPAYSSREIAKMLMHSKTAIARYRRYNTNNMDFDEFCEVAKAWEVVDRYATLDEKKRLYKDAGVKDNPRKHPRPPLKKLQLTEIQLDDVVDYYPNTKRVMFLMEKFKRKTHLTDDEYDTRKFGAEWLLPYKQKILDKYARKEIQEKTKPDEKKSETKDDKKSTTTKESDKSSVISLSSTSIKQELIDSPTSKKREKSPSRKERRRSPTPKRGRKRSLSRGRGGRSPSRGRGGRSSSRGRRGRSSSRGRRGRSSSRGRGGSSSSRGRRGRSSSRGRRSSSRGRRRRSLSRGRRSISRGRERSPRRYDRHTERDHRGSKYPRRSSREKVYRNSLVDVVVEKPVPTFDRRPSQRWNLRMKTIRDAVEIWNNKDPALLSEEQNKQLVYYISLIRVLDWLEPYTPKYTCLNHNTENDTFEVFSSGSSNVPSVSDISTSVRKVFIDWALFPPEKFMSRLILYLPNKDLLRFALVCKRWNQEAAPLLKKRTMKMMEVSVQDFRKARKIYDAKRKIKAFINRDPNTMNPAQKADLKRSKALLEQENLFDLDAIMNKPIILPLMKRPAEVSSAPTARKIQALDPLVIAPPQPVVQQIPIRNPYPQPQNMFPIPINQFVRPGPPGRPAMVPPGPSPVIRPGLQPIVGPGNPMNRFPVQYPIPPANPVLQNAPIMYPNQNRWGVEIHRIQVPNVPPQNPTVAASIRPPIARPVAPAQSPFLVPIQTNNALAEEKKNRLAQATLECNSKIQYLQKHGIIPSKPAVSSASAPPAPSFKKSETWGQVPKKDDLWNPISKTDVLPPAPSFRRPVSSNIPGFGGFSKEPEEPPPPPKIDSPRNNRFDMFSNQSKGSQVHSSLNDAPPPPKISRFDVEPQIINEPTRGFSHPQSSMFKEAPQNRFDIPPSTFRTYDILKDASFDRSNNSKGFDPTYNVSSGFDHPQKSLTGRFDGFDSSSKRFDSAKRKFEAAGDLDSLGRTSFDPHSDKGFDPHSDKGFDPHSDRGFDPSGRTFETTRSKGFDPSNIRGFDSISQRGFDSSSKKSFDTPSSRSLEPPFSKGFNPSGDSDFTGKRDFDDQSGVVKSKPTTENPQQTLSSTLEAVRKRLQQQMRNVEEPAPKRPHVEPERKYQEEIAGPRLKVRKEGLRVAVIDQNAINGSIPKDKWEEVRSRLNRAIMKRSMQKPDCPGPVFNYLGLHLDRHWYQCEDEFSLSFLKETVAWMGPLWPNAKLKVEEGKNILDRSKGKVWIPDPTLDLTQIMAILLCQNSMIAKSDLVVLGVDGNKTRSGQCIILEMTKTAEEYIRRTGGMINFGVDQIVVRFSNSNQSQDVSSSKQKDEGFWA